MKSKGGASLYEVLKSASRPGADPLPAPPAAEAPAPSSERPPSLKERLAQYKAQKLAAAQAPAGSATAVAEQTPVPMAVAEATPSPAPTQLLTPIASTPEPRPVAGPGERVLRLTYNTAAFSALVGIGLLFVAYAVGVKVGRSRAAESAPEAVVDRVPAGPPAPIVPTPPPAPPKVYTIHLIEWPARRSEEKLKAGEAADIYKKALEKQGIRNVETMKIVRGGEERLAMYVDRFKDTAADSAKSRLSALQKVKVQNQTPFAQASFEEVPR
jgi:hypothetical protein